VPRKNAATAAAMTNAQRMRTEVEHCADLKILRNTCVEMTAIAPGAEALCRHCDDPTRADRLSDERNKWPTPVPVPAPQRSAQELKALALSKISISDWSWQTPGDIVMIADFTFRNGNPFYVKDLKVLCVHTAPSGTVIDRNTRTI
jgi:hypothetical protein